MKKPSERIKELAEKSRLNGIDPGFCSTPDVTDWIFAITQYLDENYEPKKERKK